MSRKHAPFRSGDTLLHGLCSLIEETGVTVATTVNAALSTLYWQIGKRINQEILKGGKANYGKEILATLSQQLSREYGNGFSYSAFTRMVQFFEAFPDARIVATLSQTLSWSHFRLELEKSGIRVAKYLTELPSRNILEQELHKAITQARQMMSRRLESGKEMES